MNLKQSDKLIAIIGVVILVVAGIAIIFYTSSEDDGTDYLEDNNEKLYSYTWMMETAETEKNDLGAHPTYDDSLLVTAPSGTVLTSVEIELNWKDDKSYGLLFKRGYDTLQAEITQMGGDTKEDQSKQMGNFFLNFMVYDRPNMMSGEIKADSSSDAENKIKQNYSNQDEESFDVMVTVDPGERIIRLLRWIRDRGNNFDLTITYNYYDLEIEEIEDEDDETKKTGSSDDWDGSLGEFWRNMASGHGRAVI